MVNTKRSGFSLIELLIVVAIASILLSIAYPSYNTYVLKSHRSDALAAISLDQITLERCYAQTFSYNDACPGQATFPHNSARGYYRIALSNVSATSYTLTATPIGRQAIDETCNVIIVDQANQKSATDSSGLPQPVCWGM